MRLPVTNHTQRNEKASTSELVNCFLEAVPPDAKAPYILKRCAGTKELVGISTAAASDQIYEPIRGLHFHAAGTGEKILAIGTSNAVGRIWSIPAVGSPVSFSFTAGGGNEIDAESYVGGTVIVSPPLAYTVTGAAVAASVISDADFTSRGAADVEFLDNFLLFREPGTGRFFGSDLGSATAYTSTSFATAEASPDPLVGMKSDQANLLLFGMKTIEIWDAVGGGAFPFRRVINGAIRKGCANGRTIVLADDGLFFVADDFTVRRLDGMSTTRVSNHGIEQVIQDNGVAGAAAFWYQWDGHNFYCLRHPKYCFVLDTTTGMWHQRRSGGWDTWIYSCSVKAWNNKWYFGADKKVEQSATQYGFPVGYMDKDTHTEVTTPQTMSWTYQPVYRGGFRVFHDRLELTLNVGSGAEDSSTDGDSPEIMLEFSDDDGLTWTSGPNRDIGAYGEGYQRVVWQNLGSSYKRIYRISTSAAFPTAVVDTLLDERATKR